ncbi:SusD/RagB family nutrient-binding outer membrane lipoprotein [Sphingobacterium sp. HJSM2_6]|uniref:SusD/RagB family nutrient-binding outer membrane lipoprotein n=1 Tax=Sphingobacterium sp. HJSM2_6 TaxID=3366264 RepID=UPI003BD3B67A
MKTNKFLYIIATCGLMTFTGCSDQLTEININPNGVDPSRANANLILPGVLSTMSANYASLDNGVMAGLVQHMQEDGWFTSFNHYTWDARDWGDWFDVLRNNDLLIKSSIQNSLPMHEGMGYVIRAFAFGNITDLWGDAPYSEALRANENIIQPKYDNQELIYRGILDDLQKASSLFQNNSNEGVIPANDLIYQGDINKWHRLANTLLLRYAMRLSQKLPDVAAPLIKKVYDSGIYIQQDNQDAVVNYLGNTSGDSWFLAKQFDADGSVFRRRKIAKTIMDKLKVTNDPRMTVWIDPVHCQWVEDLTLPVKNDEFVRKNGVLQTYKSLTDEQYITEINAGNKFTRRYNPTLLGSKLDTGLYVGVPVGVQVPDATNMNPTPGQIVQNQHVSQLSKIYRQTTGPLLKRRIASASETYFILAEAAQRGWITANAENMFNEGIKASLTTWNIADKYNTFIARANVKYNGTLERIIEQKWIASWNCSTEAWMDFRRTGFPQLVAGPASSEPVLPVRFIYGNNEINANKENVSAAIEALEETSHSKLRGKNSQWSKPWLLQGTNKPW